MIVVAGESLVDLQVRPDGSVDASLGGGPYNVARALGRLGVETAFLGRLSTDAFGRRLRAGLAEFDVDLDLTVTTDDPTLLAIADLDDGGAATYRFHIAGTAAAGLSAGDVRGGLPAAATVLQIGTLGIVLEPMATTIAGLVADAAPDVLVLCDPNVRPAAIVDPSGYRARMASVLQRADVVKASVDDLAWLEPVHEAVPAARRLLKQGPTVVLVTDGSEPVRIVTRQTAIEVPVPAAPIVDTIGAGDAFVAGFLAAWTRAGRTRANLGDGAALAEATRFAIAVGCWSVGRAGAAAPTMADLARHGR